MKKVLLPFALALAFSLPLLGQICNPTGNILIYSNYDGGVLNINVDQNIPNLKIGVVTYEPVTINITGAYVGNVVEVRYAGYVSTSNHHCSNSPSTTTITGVAPGITSVNFLPPATLSNPNGYSLIVCNYSCSSTSNQGGCNTPDQVVDYFQTTMGGTMRYHFTQYGCWSTSPYLMSAGGNCCIGASACALVANAGPDASFCIGDTTPLNASANAAATYAWSPATGLSATNIQNPLAYPTVTTTYVVTATAGACTDTDTLVVTVNSLPTVFAPSLADVCQGDPSFSLPSGSPSGGTWSGPGVSGGQFDPAAAGAGSHLLTYSFTNGAGCTNTATAALQVNPGQVLTLTPVADLCLNDGAIALSGQPSGGTWSGPGVSNGNFDPAAAGAGNHTLTYSYSDSAGCTSSATLSAQVWSLPTVNSPSLPAICASDSSFVLPSGSPTGGVWSGTGVSGGTFSAAVAGPGNHWLYYSYTDAQGCTAVDSSLQTVNPAPIAPGLIQIGNDSLHCTDSNAVSYQWYLNGAPCCANAQTIHPTQTGDYSVQVTWANGCESTISIPFFFQYLSKDASLLSGVRFFPNPNNGKFILAAPSGANWELWAPDGRMVASGTTLALESEVAVRVAEGMYLLRVQLNGQVWTGKVSIR